jgi:hypothetical protein
MRRAEYGASWKGITDTPSFPFSKLEHRDLSALLCPLEGSCTSCTNDHYSSEGISILISDPLLLHCSEGIAANRI